jgi:hypothetical protein
MRHAVFLIWWTVDGAGLDSCHEVLESELDAFKVIAVTAKLRGRKPGRTALEPLVPTSKAIMLQRMRQQYNVDRLRGPLLVHSDEDFTEEELDKVIAEKAKDPAAFRQWMKEARF